MCCADRGHKKKPEASATTLHNNFLHFCHNTHFGLSAASIASPPVYNIILVFLFA
jgi:hypothetical protein